MNHSGPNNPFRMSITGIDGSGKDGVANSVFQMLSSESTVVQLGRPSLLYRNGESKRIFRPIVSPVEAIHNYGDRHDSQKIVLGISAINTVMQSRVLERLASHYHPTPDIIASNRDARLDSAVYLECYANKKLKSMSIEERVNRLQRLTNIHRDLVIRLHVDPEVAIQRIENQLSQQALSGVQDRSVRQIHENIDDLAKLTSAYEPASRQLQRIQPHKAVIIDTTDRTPEEVVDVTYNVINAARNNEFDSGKNIIL